MTKLSPADQKMLRKMAVDSTVEWMEQQAAVFDRAAKELRGYKERFEHLVNNPSDMPATSTPVDVLSWFVNATNFPSQNLRMDLAVKHAAALMATQPQE